MTSFNKNPLLVAAVIFLLQMIPTFSVALNEVIPSENKASGGFLDKINPFYITSQNDGVNHNLPDSSIDSNKNTRLELIADFTADLTAIEVGDIVHFYDISSGNPVFWVWEIEGGEPPIAYQQNPVAVFENAGTFDIKLTVYSPGGSNIKIKYDFITVTKPPSDLPPGWDFVATTKTHIIAVPLEANPRIHLTPILPGDYIGVFYTRNDGLLYCGGAAKWDGVSNAGVTAFGDENYTILKDGFATNEAFTWKIYSKTESKEYEATVKYDMTMPKNGFFFPTGLSALTDMYSGDVFNVAVPAGWSSISSPVDPWNKNLVSLFSPANNDLIMLYNFEGMFLPGLNVNTLVNWNNHTGYNIKMENPALIEFLGYPEKHLSIAIPQGWSYLPVPVACTTNVVSLVQPNISKVVIIRELSGFNVYWPQYNINTLQNLQPGKAYLINASGSFNLQFPVCPQTLKNSEIETANSIQLNPEWNSISANATVHTIVIPPDAFEGLLPGDILGAFTSEGYCAGMARFEGTSFAISVFGDDITTPEKDGFIAGEPIDYKMYRPSESGIYEISAFYDDILPFDGFAFNGLSAISKFNISTVIHEVGIQFNPSISPNPNDGKFVISGTGKVSKIDVMSLEYRNLLEIYPNGSLNQTVDLSCFPKGIYLLRFETPNGVLVRKIMIR